jgi:hypothetical protein
MSLNWSTENVKYFKSHPDELWTKKKVSYEGGGEREYEDLNVETKALVFGSMAVGLGSITYKSAPDFYARWKLLEKYDNYYLFSVYTGTEDIKTYLTPQVIVKHFGLGTNVSDESESVWAKRMAKNYIQEHARHYRDDSVSENEIKAFLKQAKQEFEDSFNNPEEIGE